MEHGDFLRHFFGRSVVAVYINERKAEHIRGPSTATPLRLRCNMFALFPEMPVPGRPSVTMQELGLQVMTKAASIGDVQMMRSVLPLMPVGESRRHFLLVAMMVLAAQLAAAQFSGLPATPGI